ncbi:MAG: isoprenylcysteine carboxylmethyltransferase family protein [Dehalococcoidales bacterium]|nr:isoprenylcysteine carboxylmethyltransferase family protein [Dehalococcoidales bacterium]
MIFEPVHAAGLWNAWWFMIIFPLQWLTVLIFPRHIGERVSYSSEITRGRYEKFLGRMTEIVWIGASVYSIFLPFTTGTAWFYIGLACFFVGLAVLVLSVLAVVHAGDGKPFTGGVYRFSRHPMYLSMILIYLGVGFACTSWIFLIITVVTLFLQSNQMSQEERYCAARFGKPYREYLRNTPRWIGIPREF